MSEVEGISPLDERLAESSSSLIWATHCGAHAKVWLRHQNIIQIQIQIQIQIMGVINKIHEHAAIIYL